MADYLQDLLDRFSAYTDPSQYPAPAFDPTATDEENKRKKPPAPTALPAWAQQAGVLAGQAGPDTSTSVLSRILASPANPAYGVSPMSSPLSQAMAAQAAQATQPLPAWAQQAGLQYGVNGMPQAQDFPTPPAPPPEEKPSPAEPEKTPLPRERPPQAPPREVSGDPRPPDNAPGLARTDVMQAGNQPSVIQQTGQQAGMLPGAGDIFGKIMSGLGQHSNLLLAMGAGLMGAPNVWQGLGRGFAYAGPASQQDVKAQELLGQQQAVYNALRGAGAPEHLARAATLDPDIKKQMLQTYIADRGYEIKPIETTNFFGGKDTRYVAVNKFNPQDSFDIQTGQRFGGPAAPTGAAGAPLGPGGAVAGPGGAPAPGGAGDIFFAPGVTEQTLDQNKTGDDYLNQFSPMVQQSVQNYLHGNFDPRGNRQLGQAVTFIAQKYGHDIGMEADPAKINQRRAYEMQLASPKTGVGQKKWGFQQGLEHFADITDNMVKMHLSNGFNGPGGEKAAEYVNWYRSLSPDQQELIRKNQGLAMSLARELGNMSGGSGVHEAHERATAIGNGNFGSGKAAAGAAEAVHDLIDGSLRTMENERDELFPDERYRPQGSNFKSPRQQELLDRIDHNIAILKGQAPRPRETPAQVATTPTTTPKPKGNYDYDPATGGFVQRQ